MPLKLKIDEFDLQRAVQALLTDVKNAVLTDLLNAIEQNMLDMGIAEGQLFQDINIDYDAGMIYVNAPHSGYVEYGTVGMVKVPMDPYAGTEYAGPVRGPGRKGRPPREPIQRWVRKKLGDASATEPVRWKIFWEGTEPKPFLRNALDEIRNKYNDVTVTLEVAA